MLRHWAAGKFEILVVQDVDRLTRSFYDGVELEKFCLENDKEIISLSEPVDLTTPYGRFMFRVKLAMNSFYVENLLEKIRIGIERAKKEGKYKGGKKGRTWKRRT
jgi:DNA invertase Pin-like site-specific DNA recombinase